LDCSRHSFRHGGDASTSAPRRNVGERHSRVGDFAMIDIAQCCGSSLSNAVDIHDIPPLASRRTSDRTGWAVQGAAGGDRAERALHAPESDGCEAYSRRAVVASQQPSFRISN
jgi:hypothetical protein